MTDAEVYVTALHVDDIFADPTYQRTLDNARARKMAATWDRRLAGILEVSDRGEVSSPRYAVIDGQHRWASARLLADPAPLVANVHVGLTLADEAKLFDKLNRQRQKVNIWEQWRARRTAGDQQVLAIESVLTKYGLVVDSAPRDGNVGCVGTLEKIEKVDIALLDETLGFVTDIWQKRRDALDAAVIHGLALIFDKLRDEIDLERLADALLDVLPRQLKTSAVALRDMQSGTLPVLTAIVVMGLYNKKPGRKIEVTAKTFANPGRGTRSAPRDESPLARTARPGAHRPRHPQRVRRPSARPVRRRRPRWLLTLRMPIG